jgi:isoleucyl-tRNA synthetase
VNVKQIEFTNDTSGYSERVLSLVPRALGPRLGGAVQQVIKAVKAGDWSVADGVVTAGGVQLLEGEYELKSVAADADQSASVGEGVVVLDTAVTPALAAEGLARDVVRVVQQARRDAGLDVSDRITLLVDPPSTDVTNAVETHLDFIAAETLATSVELGAVEDGGFAGEVGDDETVRVRVTRAA